jgi:hypothetical protein
MYLLPSGALRPSRSASRPITAVQMKVANAHSPAAIDKPLAELVDTLVANHWRHMITSVMYYATVRTRAPIGSDTQDGYNELSRRLLGVDYRTHGEAGGLVILGYVERRMSTAHYDALATALHSGLYPHVDPFRADRFLDKIQVDWWR